MSTQFIGKRIKALREERKMTQDDLSRILGFKSRQTLSAIETGERNLTAEELMLMAEVMDESLDYILDPFRLVGEGCFSWRSNDVDRVQLEEFERLAGGWIATYRELSLQVGRDLPLMRHSLHLTKQSSYEDAMEAGERFALDFNLGKRPAKKLAEAMEQKLAVLVLMVSTGLGISAAACRLPELDTILVECSEVEGRRNFDLAHELFHILTWDTMPPEYIEDTRKNSKSRVEKLADNFAASVLMPSSELKQFGEWVSLTDANVVSKLNDVADEFLVSSLVLGWRLVALGAIKRTVMESLPRTALKNNGHKESNRTPPILFSRPFAEVLSKANAQGWVSVRRLARVLDMTIDDMYDMFSAYDIKFPA